MIGLYCIGVGGVWIHPYFAYLVFPALFMTAYLITVNHLLPRRR